MADIRENITIEETDGWVLIEVNPDAQRYTEMVIEKITDNRDIMWSTTNTLDDGGFLPYGARFDYDIYIKLTKDAVFPKHKLAITRY